ncbi:uncharacterized protein LOC126809553 [Patella vulgata]|uniref:uncharacterized protein LOC126809553 n=1 Tax=Patella vulgata TaxID=6465 RepID=UPI0024A81A44|nr:uncharacterized protein LOC126809553 [Patella vulgata]
MNSSVLESYLNIGTTVTTTSTLTVSNTNATSTTPIILISSASTERPVTLGAVGQGDNNDSVKIAVGVLVPLFIICLIASFIFYKWYRRKYPVRMILGREFAKFENPDYLNRASTLSLVRDDADDYFSRATSKATSTVSLANHTAHDNLAFQHDKNNLNPSDDDYDIVKRKSFLFKSLEEHRDWMETGFASATSSQSSVFESVPTESDKASEISNNNSTSAKEQINVHRSQEELHNLKNSNQNFPKDTPIETILGQVKDRRSFTDDPTLGRQKDYDSVSLSKYRSQSADPISPTQVYTELQGQRPEEVVSLQSDHSVSSDSEPTVNISEEQLENNSDLPKNIRGDSDVSIVISDEIDLGVSPSIIIEQEQIQNSIRNKSPTSENEKIYVLM